MDTTSIHRQRYILDAVKNASCRSNKINLKTIAAKLACSDKTVRKEISTINYLLDLYLEGNGEFPNEILEDFIFFDFRSGTYLIRPEVRNLRLSDLYKHLLDAAA
jgi:hypothetical protein